MAEKSSEFLFIQCKSPAPSSTHIHPHRLQFPTNLLFTSQRHVGLIANIYLRYKYASQFNWLRWLYAPLAHYLGLITFFFCIGWMEPTREETAVVASYKTNVNTISLRVSVSLQQMRKGNLQVLQEGFLSLKFRYLKISCQISPYRLPLQSVSYSRGQSCNFHEKYILWWEERLQDMPSFSRNMVRVGPAQAQMSSLGKTNILPQGLLFQSTWLCVMLFDVQGTAPISCSCEPSALLQSSPCYFKSGIWIS